MLPLDDAGWVSDSDEPAANSELHEAFDRAWIEIAIERAREKLRKGNERYALVIDDLIRTRGEGSADLPELVSLQPLQVRVLRSRARARFKELLVEELVATVADPDELAEEWQLLARHLP